MPSLQASRRRCGHYPIIANNNAVVAGNDPSLRTKPRRCGQSPIVTGITPSLRTKPHRCGHYPIITDKAPSLRATTRNPPVTAAAEKKASNNPRPTPANVTLSLRATTNAVVAGKAPSLRARHCRHCAVVAGIAPSLRALRRRCEHCPVVAGNDPQHSDSSKKNVKQPKPHHYGQSPVIAGNDPQPPITIAAAKKSVGQKNNNKQQK